MTSRPDSRRSGYGRIRVRNDIRRDRSVTVEKETLLRVYSEADIDLNKKKDVRLGFYIDCFLCFYHLKY